MPSAWANDLPPAFASMSFTSSRRATNAESETPWTPEGFRLACADAPFAASRAAAFGAPSRCLKTTSSARAGDVLLPVGHEALVRRRALDVGLGPDLRLEPAERGRVSLARAHPSLGSE